MYTHIHIYSNYSTEFEEITTRTTCRTAGDQFTLMHLFIYIYIHTHIYTFA